MTGTPKPCGTCGSTTTTRAYRPALLAWFCVGADAVTCYQRAVQQQYTPTAERG